MKYAIAWLCVFCVLGLSAQALETCPPEGKAFLPVPSNCHQYHECDTGVVVRTGSCPQQMNFDPVRQICNWKIYAPCSSEPAAKDTITPIILSNSCPVENVEGHAVFIADPSNCGNYFWCNNGVYEPASCPLGQHFSPLLQLCDVPSVVECGSAPKCTTQQCTTPYCEECTMRTCTTPVCTCETCTTQECTECEECTTRICPTPECTSPSPSPSPRPPCVPCCPY